MLRIAVAILISLPALSSAEIFKSRAGGFEADFGSTPKLSVDVIPTAAGNLPYVTFTGEAANHRFVVNYFDFQAQIVAEKGAAVLLDEQKMRAITNINGTVKSQSTVGISGYPGISYKIEFSNGSTVSNVRSAMAGNRLFAVYVVSTIKHQHDESVERFLTSFKIDRDMDDVFRSGIAATEGRREHTAGCLYRCSRRFRETTESCDFYCSCLTEEMGRDLTDEAFSRMLKRLARSVGETKAMTRQNDARDLCTERQIAADNVATEAAEAAARAAAVETTP